MKFKQLDNLNVTESRPGVHRRVFTGDGATLAFTELEQGHQPMPHSHVYEQIVYVISGEMRFTVGDEVAIVKTGDLIVIPPNVTHFAENIGDGPALDLSVFSPRREDYAAEEQ